MSRRTERIGSLIRQIVGEVLLSKFSDPRVNPALTSVTSVEVTDDLLTARVYVSVMDTQARQNLAVGALRNAAGYFQETLGRQMRLRHTPTLIFELDTKLKKTLETLLLIQQAADELQRKDRQESSLPDDGKDEPNDSDDR